MAPPPRCSYLRLDVVGRGGALLRCDAEIAPGTRMDLEICLAGGVIRARARALYCLPRDRDFAIGVEFVGLAGAGDERLLELLIAADDPDQPPAPGGPGGHQPT